jgi:hypothetical protein
MSVKMTLVMVSVRMKILTERIGRKKGHLPMKRSVFWLSDGSWGGRNTAGTFPGVIGEHMSSPSGVQSLSLSLSTHTHSSSGPKGNKRPLIALFQWS